VAEASSSTRCARPPGKRKGSLAHMHGPISRARVKTLVARNGCPRGYDDVIFAASMHRPARRQHCAHLLARGRAALHVPGVTIDRQCGSSQQAVHFAAQAVMSGTQDVVIAGGVQTMTQISDRLGDGVAKPLGFNDRSRAARAGSSASATSRCRSSMAPS